MNNMIEFWKSEEQYFTDCRLDSYYMVMKFLGNNINPAKLFISAGITNEQCIVVNIRYKDHIIKTPIILSSERCFEEDLCKLWNISYRNIQSEDVDAEIQLIQDMLDKDTPVIVEIISLFLQEKNMSQKGTVFSGVSTITVIGYDCERFILGTKDSFSNELLHISYEQYRKARINKCIPYTPRDGIVILENKEGEIRNLLNVAMRKLWLKQLKRLYSLDGLVELNARIEEYLLNGTEKVEEAEKLSIIKTQLTLIAKSLCKGSYGGYYYELAHSGFQLGYITEDRMKDLKEIGLAWKRCYITLEQIINKFKVKQEIEEFRVALDNLITMKQKYLKDIIEEEENKGETIIND